MTFCQQCGQSLKPNATFCSHCGNQLPALEVEAAKNEEASVPKKTLSKKVLIAIVASVGVVLILGITHLILSSIYKSEKVLVDVALALQEKDVEAFTELLEDGGTKAPLDKKAVKGFMDYIIEEKGLSDLQKELSSTLRKQRNGWKDLSVDDEVGNILFEIVEKPKKFSLYPQYALKVHPVEVTVSSNFAGVTIEFAGKKLSTLKDEDEVVKVGEFLPGNFTFTATLKNSYGTIDEKETFSASEATENRLEAYLELDAAAVSITSNRRDAKLFINGKDTGKTVSQLSLIGPIPLDGSVELYAVAKGFTGNITSEVVAVEEKEVELWFPEEEEVVLIDDAYTTYTAEELEDFMWSYMNASVNAVNFRNFYVVADYHYPNGPSYVETENYLPYLEEKGITEEAVSIQLEGFKETDKGYEVTIQETYNIYYGDGTAKQKTFLATHLLRFYEFDDLRIYQLLTTKETHSTDL